MNFVQDYQFLDLRPMSIDIQLNNALSKQNIRVSVPSRSRIWRIERARAGSTPDAFNTSVTAEAATAGDRERR